jgi:type IV secretory pathway TraG/TraD family ATPase VirD4
LFIQTAGSNLLSLTDDINRRVYMILDEFGQLPNMTTIESLMTAARSKGGAIFIGVQDIGQLDKIYKKETRTTILNSASNRLVFNCKDRDTAEFFSKDIGETEYWELNESQSLGMHKNDRVNSTRQRHKEFLVKPEDIQQLQDLSAYISIGHNEVTLSKWNYLVLDSINQAFTQRSNLNLDVVVDVVPNSSPTLEETIKNTKQSDIDLTRTNKYQVEPNNDNLLEQQIAGIYNSDEEIYSENPRKNPEQIDIHENWN